MLPKTSYILNGISNSRYIALMSVIKRKASNTLPLRTQFAVVIDRYLIRFGNFSSVQSWQVIILSDAKLFKCFFVCIY